MTESKPVYNELAAPCADCPHARLLHHNPEITGDTICHARDCGCREFRPVAIPR